MRSAWPILFRVAVFSLYAENLVTCLQLDTYEREREKYGSRMRSYINSNVDPCDDFYEYACGNYFNVNKEEPSLGISGAIFLLRGELENIIHEMLMEPVLSNKTRTAADVARIFYQSCMRENIFEYKKSEAYLKLINSLGGWPVLNPEWKSDKFDWFKVVSAAKSYDVNTIFDESSNILNGFSVLTVDNFGLFPMDKFLKRKYSRAYHKNKEVAKQILMMYGVSKRDAVKTFNEIVDFAIKLKSTLESKNERKGRSVVTLKKLEETSPTVDWRGFYSNLYDKDELDAINITIYSMDKIKSVVAFFTENDAKVLANYIFLKFLLGLHDELTNSKIKKQFCVQKARKMMNPVVSAMFLKSKHYEKHLVDEVLALNSYIKDAFIDSIMSVKWLDNTSKTSVLKKVNAIQVVIGDNMRTLDIEKFDRDYKEFDISTENGYHQNHLVLRKFATKHNGRRNPFKITYGIDVSAFYLRQSNQLIVPAGIFRRPFYYPELPKSYNFGGIGAILGHEMTHSLDMDSINYDENGEWTDMLSKGSNRKYFQRVSCFMDQYDNYPIFELNRNVDGLITLSDNIADNGGLRHAFYGYKMWLEDYHDKLDINKQTLPGLNVTDVQLFFLSYAQTWCQRIRGLEMNKKQNEGDHAPARWRIIGSLSNFKEFSTAFGCKIGSLMNRRKKCIIW